MTTKALLSEKGKPEDENVFKAPECQVKKVTVYADRAEVCRTLEARVLQGVNEIHLRNLPSVIIEDSIRVEGTGNATIEEVSFRTRHVTVEEKQVGEEEKELEKQQKDLLEKKEEIEARQSIIKNQWNILNKFSDSATTKPEKEQAAALGDQYFKGVTGFLSLYGTEAQRLEMERMEVQREAELNKQKLETVRKNLQEIRSKQQGENTSKRECTIVLRAEGEEKANVTLTVSYVVLDASWTPSYDIRMHTSDGKMQIQYYGQIKQSTGEDWEDAKLFLSTASPSVGGSIPSLGTLQLAIRKPMPFLRPAHAVKSRGFSFRKSANANPAYAPDMMMVGCAAPPMADFMAEPMMLQVEAQVAEGITSTTYEITRPSTIPSDNSEHRVTVGLINVEPELRYVTVPKVAPQAFLQAHVTNKSSFALLPGPTSIFLDNAFVAKAELKAVAPQEEFECSLGVDPSVRVTYKPQKKYSSTTGLLSKMSVTTHEQAIEIKNLHDYKIKITVRDQLPRSTEDKIKVQLLEPSLDMKHPEKTPGLRLTKASHLEWELELDKQETRELLAKYTVELPKGEELATSEVVSSD